MLIEVELDWTSIDVKLVIWEFKLEKYSDLYQSVDTCNCPQIDFSNLEVRSQKF